MKLARLFLCVFVVCILLSGSVVLIPRMAGPYRISWLGDSTCSLPCWRGISPGVTTPAEAERLLLTYADIQGEERPVNTTEFRLYTLNAPRGQIKIAVFAEDEIVRTIWFYPPSGKWDYYFADLVAQLGTPSVLRLHAMRLLYRYDERQVGPIPPSDDNSAYGRAKDRLQRALRETEIAINEARVDTAIANAHHILADSRANHRWLQDALTRLQTVGARNLIGLADAIPAPELPPLGLFQKVMFRVLGIKQEEIARRNLKSLREIASLQHSQLVEMAQLLAESFVAIGDQLAAQQALALLAKLSDA